MPDAETMGDAVDSVERVETCRLVVSDASWAYATDNAAAINSHWLRRHAENPAMFDGIIHLVHAERRAESTLSASLLRTDFKSYLHWRDAGFPEAGVRDGFGSALIRSAEGHVLLGRQRKGNINAGFAYLPGGFIDPRDIRPDGVIDIDASIARELAEETGLGSGDVSTPPGYLITRCGPLVSIAREVVSPLPAEALRNRIRAHIASDPDPELEDIIIVRNAGDLAGARVHAYARLLLRWVLGDA